MRLSSDCRTHWRLQEGSEETSYSNGSEARLEYGGWDEGYINHCLAGGKNHCLWLVAVDGLYGELLSTGLDVSRREDHRVNIDIPEQVLRKATRFRFDITSCNGYTHSGSGREENAISSDEFRVSALASASTSTSKSTSTRRIAGRDTSDLSVGSKTGIGIGVVLALITLVSLGFLHFYRRRRRKREIESYLAASRPARPPQPAAVSTMASPAPVKWPPAEMPAENNPKQPIFEMEGRGRKLGELQGSAAANEMFASSPSPAAAPVELPGSIP
ncbi:hypothetical protein MGYG_01048 [Nannizzia gypsea CBS 118893]|uniref:Uncharacterized protein n=1 Tax=Arthroderma gypseum (strain ATCC MYA-4604 / CBS 118893) TaxID=535722 RepID=E5R3V2_ARTGP|nr:hypothetical protein MGYG_01048 [Nannizzia gypsea CBS 118893]EFQ98012.1 hypothetical protein MGYG_01048 [Nannizzia gypsea CBS 118893]